MAVWTVWGLAVDSNCFFLPTALVLGELMDNMLHRFPFMEKAEIRQMINGPESFTPDGRYLLGEVPEVGLESNEHRSF